MKRELKLLAGVLLASTALGSAANAQDPPPAAPAPAAGSEEIFVTAQKRRENIQKVPIAVSAFSADQLQKQKIDGGPNLVLSIPNVNFSKGNFTGYNFSIRGIGSKLVAASGDAGTGIHLNNAPLVANNLFESEFFDVERVEVLRGPQGTLYGRNATGGVVNLITNKPIMDFAANGRVEYGNFQTWKVRGMVNAPLGDMFAVRVAGSYLKRDGYGINTFTGNDADDRDLYNVRATILFQPSENFNATLLWDHFSEDDSRSRIGRQLCSKDNGPATVGGVAFGPNPIAAQVARGFFSQGCRATTVDAPDIMGTINTQATLGGLFGALAGFQTGDALAGKMQDPNVRNIESFFDPIYRSKTDIFELNLDWDINESLKLTSLTSYVHYTLFTRQDYSRYVANVPFNTDPNPYNLFAGVPAYGAPGGIYDILFPGGNIADPQNGTANRFRTSDISSADTKQWSTELRLQSAFDGPFNFNVGVLYLNLVADGDYYVMFNTGTGFYQVQNTFNVGGGNPAFANCIGAPPCISVDPSATPDRSGRNYYDAYSPYELTSKAIFGELYYQMTENFKWTLGLRYTDDNKRLDQYPVVLGVPGVGLGVPAVGEVNFTEFTGRFGFDWTFNPVFSDETLFYAFYSRGYKAGGLNSPCSAAPGVICGPPTFQPEFINAYEAGFKNTFADGKLIINLTGFYYDYEGYQVSKIVNRASTNENINAEVRGFEGEALWMPGAWRFNLNFGYLDTRIGNSLSLDTFNRTQGDPDLTLVKSSAASNCVIPTATAAQYVGGAALINNPFLLLSACNVSNNTGAGTNLPGSNAPAVGTNTGTPGLVAPYLVSDGVLVQLEGNRLPNAPQWTLSFGMQHTWDLGTGWDLTLRGDFYFQSFTFSRVYNADTDLLPAWHNINLTATVTSLDGWTIDAFVKNATAQTVITDTYLTDDSSGLFRNAFYTEPRTFGLAVGYRF